MTGKNMSSKSRAICSTQNDLDMSYYHENPGKGFPCTKAELGICVYVRPGIGVHLRRNPPDVRVTSGQKPSTKIIYIVLQTSVGLF